MAVNLIPSNDITITQTDNDITLNVRKDSSVSTSSTKPVENQAITNYVDTEITNTRNYALGLNEYSTTNEIRIGTWIDNKPLYRKVFTGNLVDGDLTIDMSSYNMSVVVNTYGRCGTIGNYRPLNFYLSGYYISTRYSGGTMYIAASSAYAGEPFELVVEYTKN
ncbi:MAG: hypothetical protein IKI95_03365 [Clostridia bacterium]|nr:hypothetical protein [Clostridia bacterium]